MPGTIWFTDAELAALEERLDGADHIDEIATILAKAAKLPRRPPSTFPERLEQARKLIEKDGASHSEVSRVTKVSRKILLREFPGTQWTQEQAGRAGVLARKLDRL